MAKKEEDYLFLNEVDKTVGKKIIKKFMVKI